MTDKKYLGRQRAWLKANPDYREHLYIVVTDVDPLMWPIGASPSIRTGDIVRIQDREYPNDRRGLSVEVVHRASGEIGWPTIYGLPFWAISKLDAYA